VSDLNSLVRPVISVYLATAEKKVDLYNAYEITIKEEFGAYPELTFKHPVFLIDSNGQSVFDSKGEPIYDTKIELLKNEHFVWVNDNVYAIKAIEHGRELSGKLYINYSCKHKVDELSYKQISYLDMSPPLRAPVNPKRAILEAVTQPNQIDLGYGNIISASFSGFTLDTTSTVDFNGYFITLLSGQGEYQTRRISSYSTIHKGGNVSPLWTIAPNTTSVYRIHRSEVELGFVSPELMNDGVNNILRSFKFEDTTIMDGLNTIAQRFGGKLRFRGEIRPPHIITKIDLVIPNEEYNYEFRYGKDINSISRTIDSDNGCYTRVYPEGRNNLSVTSVPTSQRTDSSITYDEHVLGSGEIFNFKYWLSIGYSLEMCKRRFVRDFRFIEEGYTDAQMLFEGGKKALDELSMPKVTYEITSVDFPTDDNKIIQRLKKHRIDSSDFILRQNVVFDTGTFQTVRIKMPPDITATPISGYGGVSIDGFKYVAGLPVQAAPFTWYTPHAWDSNLYFLVFLFPNNYFSTDDSAIGYLLGTRINYPVSTIMGSYTEIPEIGDKVAVKDTQLGFDFTATVAERIINYDKPQSPTIVLSNFIDVMGDLYYKIIKSQEGYSFRKSLYGKGTTVTIADQKTSRNWRYADYFIPEDGSVKFGFMLKKVIEEIMASGNGGEIFLFEGDYFLEESTLIPSCENITIRGAGASTIIRPAKVFADPLAGALKLENISNFYFKDLSFNSNGSIDFERLLNFASCNNIIIDNVSFEYTSSNRIRAIDCFDLTVKNSSILCSNKSNTTGAIIVFNSNNITITQNTIDGRYSQNGGIIVIFTDDVSKGSVEISDNYIRTTEGVELSNNPWFITVTAGIDTNVNIKKNVFITNGVKYTQGIKGTGTYSTNIVGNTLYGSFLLPAIECLGSSIGVVDSTSTVVDNTLYVTVSGTSRGFAIELDRMNGCRVQNNTIRRGNPYHEDDGLLRHGVAVLHDCQNVIVSGNDLAGSGSVSAILDHGTNTLTLGGNRLV